MSTEIEFQDEFELDLDSSDFEGFDAEEVVETIEEESEESTEENEGSSEEEEEQEDTSGTFTLGDDEGEEEGEEIQEDDIVKNIINAFAKEGVITADDEDLKKATSLEDLKNLVQKTIQKNEFSDLNEEAKAAIEAIRKGVPIESVKATHNLEVTLNNIKEDDFVASDNDTEEDLEQKATLRSNLIMRDLLNKNFSKEKAEKLLKRSIENGDDIDDAKEAHANLLAEVKARKAEDLRIANEQKERVEKDRENLVKAIEETKEIIPGVKLTEEVKKYIKDGLTTPTGRTKDGRLRTVISDKRDEDPVGFNTKLLYYMKLGLFNKEPDLSTLKNSKVSSAVAELEKNLRNSGGNHKGGRGLSLGNSGGRSTSFDALDDVDFDF